MNRRKLWVNTNFESCFWLYFELFLVHVLRNVDYSVLFYLRKRYNSYSTTTDESGEGES